MNARKVKFTCKSCEIVLELELPMVFSLGEINVSIGKTTWLESASDTTFFCNTCGRKFRADSKTLNYETRF